MDCFCNLFQKLTRIVLRRVRLYNTHIIPNEMYKGALVRGCRSFVRMLGEDIEQQVPRDGLASKVAHNKIVEFNFRQIYG